MISSICSSCYRLAIAGASQTIQLVQENLPLVLSQATNQLVQLGLQDQRIGRIIGGVVLFTTSSHLFAKTVQVRYIQPKQNVNQHPHINRWRWTAVGLAAMITMAYGVSQVAAGVLEITSTPHDKFLVCHDNKHLQHPRLGIVDLTQATYHEVQLDPESELAHANDLESLNWLEDHQYIACESKGKCYQFDVDQQEDGSYVADLLRTFKLACPDQFYNIEGIILKQKEDLTEMCWSHRGGIYKGEEPWTRCGQLNLDEDIVTHHTEMRVEDPFGISHVLNRAISDHAYDSVSEKEYFIGTIDTEGSKGILATNDITYSILYTREQSLDVFLHRKIEAVYADTLNQILILATDNDNKLAGAEICTYRLETGDLKCETFRQGQEFGIGGLAPYRE